MADMHGGYVWWPQRNGWHDVLGLESCHEVEWVMMGWDMMGWVMVGWVVVGWVMMGWVVMVRRWRRLGR